MRGFTPIAKKVQPEAVQLAHKLPGDKTAATSDGIMMFDPEAGCPTYSYQGKWYLLPGTDPEA